MTRVGGNLTSGICLLFPDSANVHDKSCVVQIPVLYVPNKN